MRVARRCVQSATSKRDASACARQPGLDSAYFGLSALRTTSGSRAMTVR
jgi:hypothetical protein